MEKSGEPATDGGEVTGLILNAGMRSSLRQDWATPRSLFWSLNQEFHFTLDGCATAENAVCLSYLSHDALNSEWRGIVWLNPPYGRQIGRWIQKAYESAAQGATVVYLLPSRTDTSWWHDFCMKGEVRFLRGRLRFDDDPGGRAPFPSAIVVFRPDPAPRRVPPGVR